MEVDFVFADSWLCHFERWALGSVVFGGSGSIGDLDGFRWDGVLVTFGAVNGEALNQIRE